MADYALAHQFLVTATFHLFDNTSFTLTFAGSDGGDATTEIGTVRPGGMAKPVKLAGLDDTEDMTVTKPFDRALDPDYRARLKRNRGCPVDAKKQPLGRNRLPVGTAEALDCILGNVSEYAVDANGNDPTEWGVTLAVNETD